MITKTRKIKRLQPTRRPLTHHPAQNLKTIFSSVIIILLVFFVLGFFIISNWKINQRRADLISQIETLEKEIQVLEKKNQELKAGMSQLSDESYLEEMARERLGLKKPGEEVVVVLPPPESEKEKKEEKGFWQRILKKLGF